MNAGRHKCTCGFDSRISDRVESHIARFVGKPGHNMVKADITNALGQAWDAGHIEWRDGMPVFVPNA